MSRTPAVRKRIDTCPNRDQHTEGPHGYLAWHEWAEEMAKDHDVLKCSGCGLYLIVVPHDPGPQSRAAGPSETLASGRSPHKKKEGSDVV